MSRSIRIRASSRDCRIRSALSRNDSRYFLCLTDSQPSSAASIEPNCWMICMAPLEPMPGAPGIGSKGAIQIIQQFGSIEAALDGWESVKHKKYRESLRDNADLIRQSRELARIRIDLDMPLKLDEIKARPPDRAAAYELFHELEFTLLMKEYADAAVVRPASADVARNYKIVQKKSDLDDLVRALFDAESVGVAIADSTPAGTGEQECFTELQATRGIAFATNAGVAGYVDLEKFSGGIDTALGTLRDVLSNGLIEKSVHDLKRAVGLLDRFNITLEGVKDDTYLAAYLLDPTRSKYELHDLAREALGIENHNAPAANWPETAWQTVTAADLTAQTAHVLRNRILEKKLEAIYSEVELPLAPLLYRMERAGLKVDPKVLADLSNYIGQELHKLTVQIYQLAGREFNIGSPKQVGEVLADLHIDIGRKTSTGRVSTSKAVLEELAQQFELPRLIIDYRELDKLKSVYTDALPQQIATDGRIHCQLNQTVAATGRLSSSDPNLQNIPIRSEMGRRIRRAFVAEKGNKIISADYSQLELR